MLKSIFLILFLPLQAICASMSPQEAQIAYARTRVNTPSKHVLTWKDQGWADLNGNLLFDNFAHRHAKLSSGVVELLHLLQPIADVRRLEERRTIILEIQSHFESLDKAISDLTPHEHIFMKIFDKAAQACQSSMYDSLIRAAITGFVSGYSSKVTLSRIKHDYTTRNWAYLGLTIVGFPYALYHGVSEVISLLSLAKARFDETHEDIRELSLALNKLQEVRKAIAPSSLLSVAFPSIEGWNDLTLMSPDFDQFLHKLEGANPYYDEEVWEKALSLKEVFQSLLLDLGRLDAFLAVLRIYRERVQNNLPVTFATFDTVSRGPSFHFKDLANPLLTTSVSNDFSFSGHALFNGPSTCGKSASMKTIAWGHILGQSILLVPATEAHFVVIDEFRTYFNVGDSIERGESSFKAQNLAMKKLESGLDASNDRIILLLIDEPYKGVPHNLGESLVVEFVDRLIKVPNTSLLLSTHYEAPCHLAAGINFFQPELVIDSLGIYNRTFKMLPGIATWWFEKDNKQAHAFIKQIYAEN